MHKFCFYLDWAGMKPEVWAAWAQAILSALAIYMAGRFATRQEDRRTAMRVAAVTKLAYNIGANISKYRKMIAEHSGGPRDVLNIQFAVVLGLRDQLKELPLHEIGDPRIIDPITRIQASARTMERVNELSDKVRHAGASTSDQEIQNLDVALKAMRSCHDELLTLCNGYRRRWLLKKSAYE